MHIFHVTSWAASRSLPTAALGYMETATIVAVTIGIRQRQPLVSLFNAFLTS